MSHRRRHEHTWSDYFMYPFHWIHEKWENFYYLKLTPWWTGKPVPIAWHPIIVKKNPKVGFWRPWHKLEIPFAEFQKMPTCDLLEYGVEKTQSGQLRRISTPQMYYADPSKNKVIHKHVIRGIREGIEYRRELLKERLTLDPLNVVTYHKNIQFKNLEFASWNIQMNVKFLWFTKIDLLEILLTSIFFLFLFLGYFIFYELYKVHIKLKRAELLLEEYGIQKPETELTAEQMNNRWREGGRIYKKFYLGIEADYCLYEGSLIGLELIILMILGKLYIFFSFIWTKIYLFYCLNEELITYVNVYFFFILSIICFIKYRREQKDALRRWVMIDHSFNHFLNHYYRTLAWLNLYKLVENLAPIHAYVLVYTFSMIMVYLYCDAKDYWLGWNQEYRIDLYERVDWWPRVLCNQVWYHLYITLLKPIHLFLIYVFLIFFIPCLIVFQTIVYYQNKIHVKISNKYFFWNPKRYTIDEIKEQWKKDRQYNYMLYKKQNQKRGGLIIK